MTQRINLVKHVPEVRKAMLALEKAAEEGMDPVLVGLVKVRASQINHCGYCIDKHSKEARAAGESEGRLYLLSLWAQEGEHLFSEREKAALALTEAVTVLTDGFVPDEVYERAARHFEEPELARLISVIMVINAWNRIGVPARMEGGHFQPAPHRGRG